MKKHNTARMICTMVALIAILLSSYASTTVYAADDDSDPTDYTTTETTDDTETDNVDTGQKPLYYYKDLLILVPGMYNYHYFADLTSIPDWYAAYVCQTLGEEGAFKGIVKAGKNFYPFKSFTRGQFKKIIKNLFGYNLKITGSNKKCTADWVVKQLTKVGAKKYGISYKLPYKSMTGRLDRIDVSILIYEFYGLTTGKVALPPA